MSIRTCKTTGLPVDQCECDVHRMPADEERPALPPLRSRWVDTEGENGEVIVDGYDRGQVLASGVHLSGWEHIDAGEFGTRYRPIEDDHV